MHIPLLPFILLAATAHSLVIKSRNADPITNTLTSNAAELAERSETNIQNKQYSWDPTPVRRNADPDLIVNLRYVLSKPYPTHSKPLSFRQLTSTENSRREVTEASIKTQQAGVTRQMELVVQKSAEAKKIMEQSGKLTADSPDYKAKLVEYQKKQNALAQLTQKLNRLEDELAKSKAELAKTTG